MPQMTWKTTGPNRAVSGEFTILKAVESGKYVVFYGFTTAAAMTQVLDSFESWAEATNFCENYVCE